MARANQAVAVECRLANLVLRFVMLSHSCGFMNACGSVEGDDDDDEYKSGKDNQH